MHDRSRLGPLNKGMRAVSEGLDEKADRVVISGLQRVKNAEPVKPILAQENPRQGARVEQHGQLEDSNASAETPKVAGPPLWAPIEPSHARMPAWRMIETLE